jgi:hypothetical protein
MEMQRHTGCQYAPVEAKAASAPALVATNPPPQNRSDAKPCQDAAQPQD